MKLEALVVVTVTARLSSLDQRQRQHCLRASYYIDHTMNMDGGCARCKYLIKWFFRECLTRLDMMSVVVLLNAKHSSTSLYYYVHVPLLVVIARVLHCSLINLSTGLT